MKKYVRFVILLCALVFSSSFLLYPFLSGSAQKIMDNNNTKDQESALKVVKEYVLAGVFYDTVKSNDRDWMLTKADYIGSSNVLTSNGYKQGAESVNFKFEKNKENIVITIYQYSSEEDARSPFDIPISQGLIKKCSKGECGEEGQKVYRPNGELANISFRQGRFFVSIQTNSEESAKKFIDYAITTVTNK